MTAKDLIRYSIEFGHRVTRGFVDDLTDADLLVRSVPTANHIAWQLGHMIASTPRLLLAVGRAAPELPEGFEAAYTKETAASDDPKKFATKAEYLALLDQMKAASLAAVDATSDADLDLPAPERLRQRMPSVGVVLMMLGSHLVVHAGQFVPIRRKLGKQPLF
jgi:hypothetical protein